MIKKLLIAFGLAAAILPSTADEYSGWTKLQPKNSGFTVLMPGTPMFESRWIKEDGITYPAYKFGVMRGQIYYQVSYSDMNVKIPDNLVDQLLQNVIGGISQSSKSKILDSEKVTVQGRPGRIFSLADSQNVVTTGMTCWDGRHNYIVSLQAPVDELKPNVPRTFFKTFKMVPYK